MTKNQQASKIFGDIFTEIKEKKVGIERSSPETIIEPKRTHICSQCNTEMESKGEVSYSDQGSAIFYQCPNCKSIALRFRQYKSELRMTYP